MFTRCLVIPKLALQGSVCLTRKAPTTTTTRVLPPKRILLHRTMASLDADTTTIHDRAVLPDSYTAWQVEETADGSFVGSEQRLPMPAAAGAAGADNQVLIRVTHSSLNYKDALSATGNRGVTKKYPHTPGIDAVGRTVKDDKPVLVTGYDLGMNTDGGFGQYISVPSSWVLDMPSPWKDAPRTAMIYGTAGLTAGLLVHKLLMHADAVAGQVVAVTGATGAVGSVATEILSRLGFHVAAISGKADNAEANAFLQQLGAKQVLGRDVLAPSKKPLLTPRFHHAIDTVGGAPLVELLKQLHPDGSVACCGMAADVALPGATVLPFILRGNALLGVDSVQIDKAYKAAVWHKLASEWACPVTESQARDIGRHELEANLQAILQGKSAGKIVLDHAIEAPTSS